MPDRQHIYIRSTLIPIYSNIWDLLDSSLHFLWHLADSLTLKRPVLGGWMECKGKKEGLLWKSERGRKENLSLMWGLREKGGQTTKLQSGILFSSYLPLPTLPLSHIPSSNPGEIDHPKRPLLWGFSRNKQSSHIIMESENERRRSQLFPSPIRL